MRAEIITIGDELLIGQVVDTNSAWMAQRLNEIGIEVYQITSVHDNREHILQALDGAFSRVDIVLTTGGLGPTKDDITKKALYKLSGATSYRTDERQLEIVHRILHARGLDMLDINLAQASVPDTSEVIPNKLGTAPIMVFRFTEQKFGHKSTLYSLPGVPYEAIGALEAILQDIKDNYHTSSIYHKTIMTFGLAESALAKRLEGWEDNLPDHISLAYRPDTINGCPFMEESPGPRKPKSASKYRLLESFWETIYILKRKSPCRAISDAY